MTSTRSAGSGSVPRRVRAFSAAEAYRQRYPEADAATVETALRRRAAFSRTPRLVQAAASTRTPSSTLLHRQVSRLASVASGEDLPPGGVMGVWRLAVLVAHLEDAMVNGDGAGVSFGTLLVSVSRCSFWWREGRSSASRHLNELIDSGFLTVVGYAGRTRRVRLNRGSTRSEVSTVWLDSGHPWRTCVDPSIAYAADRSAAVRRWFDVVVRGEAGTAVVHDPGAEVRRSEAEAVYREAVDRQKQFAEREAVEASVRSVMRGLPQAGAAAERLDSWMRTATTRAAAAGFGEDAGPAIISFARSRGHSETIAAALAKRLIEAGAVSSDWGGSF